MNDHADRIITVAAWGTVLSLVINVPDMFGYSKIYQIAAFGGIMVFFMAASFIKSWRVQEN